MVFIDAFCTDPYFNLALEEYVFDRMDRTKQYFMLWQNHNSIIVGKYQNTAEEINQQYVKEHGIKVARRLSGGGAVYHDAGNLNFTFIVDQANNPDFNFSLFVIPVIKALDELGVKAEFNGRNDITINGKKFSGNSQYARSGRLLHHGCIMLDSNLNDVSQALRVKEAKFESKSIKSVRSRVTTINANTTTPITMQQFKDKLIECISDENEFEYYTLSQKDIEAINQIKHEKYETWEWNYGFYPDYDMKVERKFDFGFVSIALQVEHGVIEMVKISGDFFGNGDISDLEQLLIGLKLDDTLENTLETLNVGKYINGITEKDLAYMLL